MLEGVYRSRRPRKRPTGVHTTDTGVRTADTWECALQTHRCAHQLSLTRRWLHGRGAQLRFRREAPVPARGRLAGRRPSSWGTVRLFLLFRLPLTGWGVAGVLRCPTIHMYTHVHNAHSHMHAQTFGLCSGPGRSPDPSLCCGCTGEARPTLPGPDHRP